MQSTLSDIHRLRERRYKYADYGASDTLLDLNEAIKNAELTEKQREVLYLLYERDMTQGEAGKELKIGQDVVSRHSKYAIKKIAREYGGGTWEITREGNGRDKENEI